MIVFRDRMTRGATRTGWLDSRHSFSFADYDDPRQRGFRNLRVINEDRVIPGAGFPPHGHRDMEIISYVLEGALEHKDSLGNGSIIRPGEVQRMSAGTGIRHSEYNASREAPVHFLQIWIFPDRTGIAPGYEQRVVAPRRNAFELVAAPAGEGAPVTLNGDARLYLAKLDDGVRLSHDVPAGRGLWLQLARGVIALDGTEMKEGDGAAIERQAEISVEALSEAELLLFDLA